MKNEDTNTPKPAAEMPIQPSLMPTASDMAIKSNNALVLTERAQKRRAARFHARLRRSVLPIALLFATIIAASVKAATVTATLEPSEISFGEAAQLTVTAQGQSDGAPQIPSVNGLSFQNAGQSSDIQIINGAISANISQTFIVTPTRLGTFTIPAIRFGSGQSQPLVLKVLKRTGAAPQANSGQGALPAPNVNATDEDVSAPDKDSFGFLRIVSPKKQFYVGEMVPVELKAYFRAGVELRVDGLPNLNSDAFTMNKLGDHPAQTQQMVGGAPYTVLTWQTVITAVKAGDFEMSVQIPTTVTVHQRAPRPRGQNPLGDPFFDDVFNDPFFANFFGSSTQKEIALSSQPNVVRILSLPTENRPASFSGAVGQFDFSAEATPMQSAAGDPVTLKTKITGSGNFDRVNAPDIGKSDVWKAYKPSAKFEAEDSAGYSGAKTFEQALVPQSSGKVEIPALAFSFFNPETKQYVTKTSVPISIEVSPGQVASAASVPVSSVASSPTATPAASAVPGMVSNKLFAGHFTRTLRPWFFNPWLAAGFLAAIAALIAANLMIRRRQMLASDPQRLFVANTRREVQAQVKIMESAVAQGTATEFFAAARGAFQSALGLLWNVPPRAITLVEINSRMNGKAEGFRFIFELADEVTYTGRNFAPAELRKWLHTVNVELKKLEAA